MVHFGWLILTAVVAGGICFVLGAVWQKPKKEAKKLAKKGAEILDRQ